MWLSLSISSKCPLVYCRLKGIDAEDDSDSEMINKVKERCKSSKCRISLIEVELFQDLEPKAASITLTDHQVSVGTEAVHVMKMDQISRTVLNQLFSTA